MLKEKMARGILLMGAMLAVESPAAQAQYLYLPGWGKCVTIDHAYNVALRKQMAADSAIVDAEQATSTPASTADWDQAASLLPRDLWAAENACIIHRDYEAGDRASVNRELRQLHTK